jgi:putative transposase
MQNPFRYFNSSPEVIRVGVMIYIRYPLWLRQVEDILFERGIDICHETIRFWWNRFGPIICGVLWITKAKCWKFLPRNGGIARPH